MDLTEPLPEFGGGSWQWAALVGTVPVQPLFGTRQQGAIDLAAKLPSGPAGPVLREQSCRQQRIAQYHPPGKMDQQYSGRERLAVRQPRAPADPGSQWLERLHEFEISVRGPLERPAFAEQASPALVLGRNLQPNCGCRFLGD